MGPKKKNANEKLITSILPKWLKLDENKNILLDHEKASVVKLIFELSQNGMGAMSITRYLNENKIRNLENHLSGERVMSQKFCLIQRLLGDMFIIKWMREKE